MLFRRCRRPVQRCLFLTIAFVVVTMGYFTLFYVKDVLLADDKRSYEPGKRGAFFIADAGGHSFKDQEGQACVHPQLELWHKELKKYFQGTPKLHCSARRNWVYVQNGTFRINETLRQVYGDINCDYEPQLRGNSDFSVVKGDVVVGAQDGAALKSDFFQVLCTSKDGTTYKNIHSAVVPPPEVIDRKDNLPAEALGLNVLMFGFDSLSRMTWLRNLPKSHKYAVDELGGMVLEGYNIVGDGTPQALLPILTGKTETELPEARRGHEGAETVDGHPWIWKDFQKAGYVTQWGEDGASVGTFTYRMLGFKEQPVDHYMRPFYLQAEKWYQIQPAYCLGSVPRHVNMLNWIRDLYQAYPNKRKFSFLFHSEFTHGGYSEVRVVDDDLRHFLRYMNDSGYLNNTVLILMSDHGARFQSVRRTVQGKYEERMPYFLFRFPPWFSQKYPHVIRNFKTNTRRLTTPFDIHETFVDILNFTGATKGNTSQRGISLFKEIPKDRSCTHAGIEHHWCACLNWQPIDIKHRSIMKAAKALVNRINELTSSERSLCSPLKIGNVASAVKYLPNDEILKFKQSSDSDGRIADLSDTMNHTELFYQIQVKTLPGQGLFEATVKHVVVSDTFYIDNREISRINKYGNQPQCIMERLPHLRPYCYCSSQPPNEDSAV